VCGTTCPARPTGKTAFLHPGEIYIQQRWPCLLFCSPLQDSAESLAAGKSMAIPKRDQTHPLGPKARAVVQTTIEVREAPNGSCSILDVTTADR
jgi:hypothetical protein